MTRSRLQFRPRLVPLEGRDVPSTLFVTHTSDTGYAGDGSLRGEIMAANPGDTIQFAIPNTDPGYNPTTGAFTITLSSSYTDIYGQAIKFGEEIPIAKNLTIQGPGADQLTISGWDSRVFEIDGAATVVNLSGLSITGGNGMFYADTSGSTGWSGGHSGGTGTASDGQGGAIWNGGVLTISKCILSNNACGLYSTGSGGAIYNAGSLTITNSTLASNSAGLQYNHGGAGGAIFDAGNLAITNCNLTANSATDGGSIYSAYRSTTTVTGTTLSNNTAYAGGAIYNDGTTTLSGDTVTGNSAAAGGGVYDSKTGHLTIQSASKVTGNSAPAGADLENFGSLKISKDSAVGVTGP